MSEDDDFMRSLRDTGAVIERGIKQAIAWGRVVTVWLILLTIGFVWLAVR